MTPGAVIDASAGHHHRLLVRQEIRAGEGRRAARVLRSFRQPSARRLHEIKSTLILQPGPAALTDGLDRLAGIIGEWAQSPPRLKGRFGR